MGIWFELLTSRYFLTQVLPYYIIGIICFIYICKRA